MVEAPARPGRDRVHELDTGDADQWHVAEGAQPAAEARAPDVGAYLALLAERVRPAPLEPPRPQRTHQVEDVRHLYALDLGACDLVCAAARWLRGRISRLAGERRQRKADD